MTTHQDLAQRAMHLAQSISAETNELPFKATIRNRLAMAQHGTTLEHQRGIAVLLRDECRVSAFALLRPLWESYIRGMWLLHCVPDDQIQAYWKKELPAAAMIVADLKELPDFEGKVLAGHKRAFWSDMCDFTHSGSLQMQQWQGENYVEPAHTVEGTAKIVYVAGLYALLAAVSIVGIAEQDARAMRLLEVFKGLKL